ncbi:aspartate kinase [Nocardiopsis dassonvillei]|uniref:aspartate kinase n=1 Tax=Nocardiopsis dassonvillei TaxID=2014 RepID=UPI00366CC196
MIRSRAPAVSNRVSKGMGACVVHGTKAVAVVTPTGTATEISYPTNSADLRGRSIEVWKFGGSSLASPEQVASVADRAGRAHRQGRALVVVVSARGDTTDELLKAAASVGATSPSREMDRLLATGESASAALTAMAIQARGVAATSLSGRSLGILTSGSPGAGTVDTVDTGHVLRVLDSGRVAVVAGFQGVDRDGNVSTLGRGGSDTTAVALAAAFGSGHCDIHTDVDGVYTADPRVCPDTRVMPEVHSSTMAEMAFSGARVMHSRAVEIAELHGVEIRVRNSSRPHGGTRILTGGEAEMVESVPAARAVVHDTGMVRVELRGAKVDGGFTVNLFRSIAEASLPVDMVSVDHRDDGEFSSGMTVRGSDAPQLRRVLTEAAGRDGVRLEFGASVGKVSLVGTGLLSRPEYTARMLSALAAADIPVGTMSTSQSRLCVTVPEPATHRAVRVLHSAFGLDAGDDRRMPGTTL